MFFYFLFFLKRKRVIVQVQDLKIYSVKRAGNHVKMFKLKKNLQLDDKGDISMYSDLISLLKELTNAENHCLNNVKIHEDNPILVKEWGDRAKMLRDIRTKYMKILPINKGDESWCTEKHLLTATKNLDEIGNRYYFDGLESQAQECYNDSSIILEEILKIANIGGEK